MKIDLHVHSKYSKKPSQWVLQKIGCPESFTDPLRLYQRAKARGMDMVTISDHNVLDGVLEIAHLPDTFLSVEVTAHFPEDRCKVHVLCTDVTEAIHREAQKLRKNIYELVPYLQSQGVMHTLAHPLFAVNDRLTIEHFEKSLLLFKNFECNGARDGYQNDAVKRVLAQLTPQTIERLVETYGIVPGFPEPWKKNITGGSDDHSAQNIASIYTVVDDAQDLAGFKAGILAGRSRPGGRYSSPQTMARTLYSIAYQFYKHKFGFDRYVNKDIFLRFIDRLLSAEEVSKARVIDRVQSFFNTRRYIKGLSGSGPVQQVVRFEAARLICDDPKLAALAKGSGEIPSAEAEREWFRFLIRASNRVLTVFADNLLGHARKANVFDIFHTVGSAGALYSVLAPYFVAYDVFIKDRRFCDEVLARFVDGKDLAREPRVGHFTDTFFEINGVAKTLQRSVRVAQSQGKDMTIVTCHPDAPKGEGVRNFMPVGVFDLPEYPELKITYPPVLEMLEYAYSQNFTHLHASTPGPVGLTALLVAKMLKLPLYGTYHTQIPQYVGKLTDDLGMEDLAWKFILWFYNQCDMVFAPSQATAGELIERGLPESKIRIYPRGVDIQRFHPTKRNGFMRRFTQRDGLKFLYVGRVSKEKNLDLLAEAFRRLTADHGNVTLVITGDGPYKQDLQRQMADTPTIFTGYLEGEDLAELYASCDIFVFPSRTDTFGNVVLEAQASGIPAIVTNVGGPQENVVHGETGFVVDAQDPAGLLQAMTALADDPRLLDDMGHKARTRMEGRSFEQAFVNTWNMQYVQGAD